MKAERPSVILSFGAAEIGGYVFALKKAMSRIDHEMVVADEGELNRLLRQKQQLSDLYDGLRG